jgi:phage terminase large subunit
MIKKKIQLPKKLGFLLSEQSRYKSAKGGRGSAKSWSFAAALLVKGTEKPQRFLCCREFQKSIKDSVHQLLADLIRLWGIEDFYEVQSAGIFGKNGTVFGFEGLRHNITNIKSWEGADVAWVEEAQTMSKSSWDILPPTIRKKDSELWFSWNPDLVEDETWIRLVDTPPEDLIQVDMNYKDNPWFPDVLEKERLETKKRDPIGYNNIWEGKPRAAIAGAIFARELERAEEENRIMQVPYEETKTVDAFLDLGYSDQTAIWFEQTIGFQYRFINYYSNSQEKVHHYIKYMKDLPYVYGTIYLPHDANNEQLGQDKTIAEQFREAFHDVIVVPRVNKKINSIEAARSIMAASYFDRDKCHDGLTCLRRYAYAADPETGKIGKQPQHDIWSHGSDAFQTAGMAIQDVAGDIIRPQRLVSPIGFNRGDPYEI